MGSPVAELFGRNLKRVREAHGFSQEDLMAWADVHRTRDSRSPVEGLGVSIDSLVEGMHWQEQRPAC